MRSSISFRVAVACASAPLFLGFGFTTGCGLLASDGQVTSSNDNNDAGSEPDIGVVDSGSVPDVPPTPLTGAFLFAGYGEAPLSDTWDFNGSTWTQANVTGPSERDSQSMATLNGKVILFGGEFGSYLADTWEWDGLTWTQKNVTGPSARSEAPTATLGNKVVLYAGEGAAQNDDTWEWDGTSWTQIMTPGPGDLHDIGSAMATLGDKVYLFGGMGSTNDTWCFDGSTWTKLTITGDSPPQRVFHAMTTFNDKIVLFGGEIDANHFLNDTWEFDGTTWTQINANGNTTGPSERFHPAMTTWNGAVYMFGGGSVVGEGPGWLADTWQFDGTTWTQKTSDGPSARYGYVMATRP